MSETRDYLCLHCRREIIQGRRGGMFDHVNTIEKEEIRAIVAACDIMKIEFVTILHEHTLRNLLVDLSKKTVATEIFKKRSVAT